MLTEMEFAQLPKRFVVRILCILIQLRRGIIYGLMAAAAHISGLYSDLKLMHTSPAHTVTFTEALNTWIYSDTIVPLLHRP